MLSVSMPNSATRSALVETATKCLATAARRPRAASDQSRAERALVIVSRVVNVLEETMNRVSAGSRSRVASTKSVESTFETKRKVSSRGAVVAQSLVGHDRAEVRAADADIDHVANRLAGVAGPLPLRTCSLKAAMRSSTAWTCWDDVDTVEQRASDVRGMRRATCRTGRSSETLMRSPANMAAVRSRQAGLRRPRRPAGAASRR